MKTTHIDILGTVLFFSGVVIGLALAAATIWANFEAVFYNYTQLAYDEYQGLHCPPLMSISETATITATFNNPSNDILYPYYQVELSAPGLLPKFENQISVSPHRTRSVQWTVDAGNIDLGNFVFVKLTVLPVAEYAARQTTCGIFVVNAPGLNGAEIFWAGFMFSLLAIWVGFALWSKTNEPLTGRLLNLKHAMQALCVFTFSTLLAGLLGWWLQGILLIAITLALMVVMLRFTAIRSSR